MNPQVSPLGAKLRRRSAARLRLSFGAFLICLAVGLALLSLIWTPEPPTRLSIADRLQPPFVSGLIGTDQLGRDIASLLMAGAANSLGIALSAVALGTLVGTLVGLVAAFQRGFVDAVVMRAMDIVFAVPPILSAMMLGAILGAGFGNAVAAIAVFLVPVFARVARGSALAILPRDFILAARGSGKGGTRIAIEHVLPNMAGDLVVQVTLQIGLAILTEAGLGFLGLGLAPPAPSWGRMLAESQTYFSAAPWLALAPGLAIAATVLGFNLLGDGLRDRLDPRGGTR